MPVRCIATIAKPTAAAAAHGAGPAQFHNQQSNERGDKMTPDKGARLRRFCLWRAQYRYDRRREWNREERKCPLNRERLHAPDGNCASGPSGEDGE